MQNYHGEKVLRKSEITSENIPGIPISSRVTAGKSVTTQR